MKILKSISLLILFISLTAIVSKEPAKVAPNALKKNQFAAFPDSNAAPTTAKGIATPSFISPKLSDALSESDPKRRLRKNEFLEAVKYALYKLTRGEAEQIFTFVDQNKDDMVDLREWDAFTALFIQPFEACDKNGDNIVDEEEFSACWEADPKANVIDFRRKYSENKHKLILNTVSTRGAAEINFADYLFIKKAMFGWSQCHSGAKFMAKNHFKCALGTAIPQKFHSKLDYEKIYTVGLGLAGDRNVIELDFIGYLSVVYYTYTFGVFNAPADSPLMEKTQWLKAIKEDRLPNNWEESEVEAIFGLINNSATMKVNKVSAIDFGSWSFFFSLHRAFNAYSVEKPLQLSSSEFLKLMNDPFTSAEVKLAIDVSHTQFAQANYQEASLILQKYRLNEKDFFFSRFKQDASASGNSLYNDTNIANSYYNDTENTVNRITFFTTFSDTNKHYWTKFNLYRAFQLANLYISLTDYTEETDSRVVSASVFVERLPAAYDTVKPVINMKQRSNYVLYKAIPREIGVDILTFLALENYYTKFKVQTMSSNTNVDENVVKIILKDFGMGDMPDTVIDIAGKGYDSLHRRVYNPLEVAKNTIIVHAVASEQLRAHHQVKSHGLKVNKDNTREFPQSPRRFRSTDKV
jgi:hypothetical protein